MAKHSHVIEAKPWETGGYVDMSPQYNAGYEDGKKEGKELASMEIGQLKLRIKQLERLLWLNK